MPADLSNPAVFRRFSGERGEALVIEALKDQKIILGNAEAAEELFARGAVTCFRQGEFLVLEDDWANDLIFILTGRVQITITGFKVAERGSGQHVGEMALIDPSQPRSASAIAMEPTVALVVAEGDFAAVAAHQLRHSGQIKGAGADAFDFGIHRAVSPHLVKLAALTARSGNQNCARIVLGNAEGRSVDIIWNETCLVIQQQAILHAVATRTAAVLASRDADN